MDVTRPALLKRAGARDLAICDGRQVIGHVVAFDSPAASHAYDADERHLGEFRTYRVAAAAVSARAAHESEAGR